MIDLTELILHFAKEYEWHLVNQRPPPISIADGINSGLCDLFAQRVKTQFPETEILYDDTKDHVFVKIEDKFYDAENPTGVSDRKMMVFGGSLPKGE